MSWADIALGNTTQTNPGGGGRRTAPIARPGMPNTPVYAGGSPTFNEAAGGTQIGMAPPTNGLPPPVNALAGLKPGGVPLGGGRSGGMVRAMGGASSGAIPGDAAWMGTQPPMASQPGIDESRLWNGALNSYRNDTPPIFRRSDITANPATLGTETESGNRIGATEGGFSAPGNLGSNGQAYFAPIGTQAPGQTFDYSRWDPSQGFTFGMRSQRDASNVYDYQLDPTGQYFVPGQGRTMSMPHGQAYGPDFWMPLAMAATMGAGVYGAGAGAATGVAGGTAEGAGGFVTPGAASGVGGATGAGTFAPAAGAGTAGGTVAGSAPAGTGSATTGITGAGGGAAGGGSSLGSAASGFFDNAGNWVPLANAAIGVIGANRAAGQQSDAANRATQLQGDIYQQNRADLAPWRQAGGAGLSRLQYLLGLGGQGAPGGAGGGDYGSLMRDFGMSDYQADPGYQFRMQQGEEAINRNALASGRYNSGSVLRALQDFNSGLASQEYGNAFNRFQTQRGTRLNALQSLSGVGQSATNQTGQFGQNYANQAGSNMIGAGNAAAAGTVGGINAITGGLGQYLNYNQSQQQMQQQQQYNNAMLEALRGYGGGYGGQPRQQNPNGYGYYTGE